MKNPSFDKLISPPWGEDSENSYYGDPSHLRHEQHGLEHLDGVESEEKEEIGKVVILGYN